MLAGGYVALRFYKREKASVMAEVEERIHEELQGALDTLGEVFEGIFEKPIVKKGMSIIGSQGGQAKAERGLVERIATDALNGPQFAAIKMGAKSVLGIDVDQYVEENGAMNTLAAVKQIAGALGIDVNKALLNGFGDLSAPGSSSGYNPYLGR